MAAVACVCSVSAKGQTSGTTEYLLVDLGVIDAVPNIQDAVPDILSGEPGVHMNNNGEVVYLSDESNSHRAWVWLPNAAYGLSPGRHYLDVVFPNTPAKNAAYDINDDGLIVGHSGGSFGSSGQASLWNLDNDTFYELGYLTTGPDTEWSTAVSITNGASPVIAGTSNRHWWACKDCDGSEVNEDDPLLNMQRGFRTTVASGAPGSLEELSPIGGEIDVCNSTALSTDGSVTIGFAHDGRSGSACNAPSNSNCDGIANATAWVASAVNALADLGVNVAHPWDINDAGNIVGWAWLSPPEPSNCTRKAVFIESATATSPVQLPVAVSGHDAIALALNDATEPEIVGFNDFAKLAALWRKESGSYVYIELQDRFRVDLGSCSPELISWTLKQAHDINNSGWIVGIGFKKVFEDGQLTTREHAFLLKPPNNCAGDFNQDGIAVDVADLLDILAVMGDADSICGVSLDADNDVDVMDLLAILDNWGNCAGGGGPDSLEEELMAVGLPSDADDEYLSVLQNGTQAEIDNYNCWVDHYLLDCGPLCQHNCPDNDPWGKH